MTKYNETRKYPQVTVKLLGADGNAFAILGASKKAAKAAGLTDEQITEYMDEAMSGDYEHLLSTTFRFFNTD